MSARLESDAACLVVVDFQERFLGAVEGFAEAASRGAILCRAAAHMQLPVIATEQYPKGLGPTVPGVATAVEGFSPLEKTCFAATRAAGFDLVGRRQAVVCGVEAHVCVMQTVLDLLEQGIDVFLPVDAVASRHGVDRETAIARMGEAGAVATTTEALVFELAGGADHPAFRDLQGLVK